MSNFWSELEFPIIGLSPMDGVTDAAMRYISKKYGKADILYTEFVSAEGLWRIKKRGEMENKIWQDLRFDKTQGPNIVQLFGSDPESFYESAKIVCEMGFDGIDINMGCPSPGLEKRGGGAGLIRDKCNAVEVVEATRRGVNDYIKTQNFQNSPHHASGFTSFSRTQDNERLVIQVSLKTRLGSDKPDRKWWELIASMKMPAVAMHGRTFKQLYSGQADWDLLLEAAQIIRESGARFLGNGDIRKVKSKKEKVKSNEYFEIETSTGREVDLTGKMDGVLIGREAIGNPWILRHCELRSNEAISELGIAASPALHDPRNDEVDVEKKLSVAIEHARKFEELLPEQKFFVMRKHLVKYVTGFEQATEIRKQIVQANSSEDVRKIISEYLEGR